MLSHRENVRTSKDSKFFSNIDQGHLRFLLRQNKFLHACVPIISCSTAKNSCIGHLRKQYKKQVHLSEFLAIAVTEKTVKRIYSRSFDGTFKGTVPQEFLLLVFLTNSSNSTPLRWGCFANFEFLRKLLVSLKALRLINRTPTLETKR
jgi:hypothetical protein